MNPYLRYALIASAAAAFLLACLAILLAFIVDPNAYKPLVIQLVKEKQRRNLGIGGHIALSFFPRPGVAMHAVSLSEHEDDVEFARVERIHASLALVPLLRGKVVVDGIAIRGLQARLVRFRDGRTNVDDLLASGDEPPPFELDLDDARVEGATLVLRDEPSEREYTLGRLDARIERRSGSSEAEAARHAVSLSFQAVRSGRPDVVDVRLGFGLAAGADASYRVDGLELEATGSMGDADPITMRASGHAGLHSSSGGFAADGMALDITGAQGSRHVDVRLEIPHLSLVDGGLASGLLKANVKAADSANPLDNGNAEVTLSDLSGTPGDFRSDALTLGLESRFGERRIVATLASPLRGSVDARRLELPDLIARIHAEGPDVPGGLDGELQGSATLEGEPQRMQIHLAGKAMGSNAVARLTATGFSEPDLEIDAQIDRLDIDRFLPDPRTPPGRTGSAENPSLEALLDTPLLRNSRMRGSIRIGTLTSAGFRSSNVKLELQAAP